MMIRFFNACWLLVALFLVVNCVDQALAEDLPQPTLLAKRGALILDDDGSKDRGGKVTIELNEGVGVRAALGIWKRAESDSNVWRSMWEEGMGHPPVASYRGLVAKNLVVEVTFRYGPNSESWHSQFLRIAADQRPQIKGHIVSAWVNLNGPYTEKGIVIEHVPPRGKQGILMDHQPLSSEAETWLTATLEIVGDETLFRMGDHVAYAKKEEIGIAKNLVSLTLGTTWHEIKRVRIWHAEENPDWKANKDTILKSREPFIPRPR